MSRAGDGGFAGGQADAKTRSGAPFPRLREGLSSFSAGCCHLIRTLSFRLNLLYATVFTGCALILFWVLYYLLGAAIDRKDREIVEARLREYAAIYEAHDREGLRRWIFQLQAARKQKTFFTRVTAARGHLLLLSVPDNWEPFDVRLLRANEEASEHKPWVRIPRDDATDLTVASTELSDGTMLQVARSADSLFAMLRKFRWIFIVIIPPVALLGMLAGAIMAHRATRPLRQLATAVRAIIDTGKLDVRVPTRRTRDELQDLIALFNQMIARNEALNRAMRESLDDVAHDVRTPLTRLRFVAESALENADLPDTCAEPLRECVEETDRIRTIIQTLLEVARAEGGVMQLRRERVNAAELAQDAVELYEHIAQEKGITLRAATSQECWIMADATRLRQAFANLLDNAVKYTLELGSISVEARCDGDAVSVAFRDTGVGIEEEDIARIWDRLFRAERSRIQPGLGLGLSLVKAIVEANGGRVAVLSQPGKGSEFTVTLPAVSKGQLGVTRVAESGGRG